MDTNTYWFITGVSNRPKHDNRHWGFFDNFDDAEKAVLDNDGDIYECEYEHMVIEGHKMGTWGISTGEMHWYQYDKDTRKFNPVATPPWAVNITNWGIG